MRGLEHMLLNVGCGAIASIVFNGGFGELACRWARPLWVCPRGPLLASSLRPHALPAASEPPSSPRIVRTRMADTNPALDSEPCTRLGRQERSPADPQIHGSGPPFLTARATLQVALHHFLQRQAVVKAAQHNSATISPSLNKMLMPLGFDSSVLPTKPFTVDFLPPGVGVGDEGSIHTRPLLLQDNYPLHLPGPAVPHP